MTEKKNDYRWSDSAEPNRSFTNQAYMEKYLANYRKNVQNFMQGTSTKKKSK